MGMLIQTKGTQFLANFLNTMRFDAADIVTMRTVGNLITSFATPQPAPPIFTLSEMFVASWPTDGSDIFYPTATVSTVQAANNNATLTFTSALPTWLTATNPTASVWDQNNQSIVPKGTVVQTINSNTSITLNNPVTVLAGDKIVFSDPRHPNLIKRWRYYLKNELSMSCQIAIQTAILQILNDNSYTSSNFQAVESAKQKVLTATEYPLRTNGKLNLNQKYMSLVLLTAPTANTSDPLDPQV